MMAVSWRFNEVMALLIVAMVGTALSLCLRNTSTSPFSKHAVFLQILQVVIVRYLHTAYRNGLHVGNQIICQAYLLRSLTDTEVPKTVRRKMFRKRRQVERTQHWVSMRLKPGRLRGTNTSGSDAGSSDELLQIDE